ncbi:hypothetical protein DUNSADRAFT_12265 [Dunaliella salina]|uniref:Encoded protein n=1 Tax=Dunaliella salina TaxID=3046 RepID=A0ABQ7H3Y1_DUNSA|nr:hypothetical protein DUNSADRAFT_12265 [Dunaliella salina]|eukprot:KAF5841567.1 hypothetical protein DUNSADRAFT_12265 [Dunaliella salina]
MCQRHTPKKLNSFAWRMRLNNSARSKKNNLKCAWRHQPSEEETATMWACWGQDRAFLFHTSCFLNTLIPTLRNTSSYLSHVHC